MPPVDAHVRLFYSDAWQDVTQYARHQHKAHISRGVANEGGQAGPTQVEVSLDNRDNRFSFLHPTSALYGLIGRNTPLRVDVGTEHRGVGDFSETAGTSHVAPSVTASKAGLLISAWKGSRQSSTYVVNYTKPASMTAGPETDGDWGTMRSAYETVSAGATGTRTATASASSRWVAASVVLHGDTVAVEEELSGVGVGDTDFDVTLTTASATAGWWLVAVQAWDWFPIVSSRLMPDAPHGDEGGWVMLADSGQHASSNAGTTAPAQHRVRVWARRVTTTGVQTVTFAGMDAAPGVSGNDSDNHAHLYVLSGVDYWSVRATVEAPRWSTQRDTSGNDVLCPVQGGGVLRRAGRISKITLSALRETHTGGVVGGFDSGDGAGSGAPRQYWHMEQSSKAGRASASLPGGSHMFKAQGTIVFGAVEGPAGSDPLPDLLQSTGRLVGFGGSRPAHQAGFWGRTDTWLCTFVISYTGAGTWTAVSLDLASGIYDYVQMRFSTQFELVGIDASGTNSIGTVAVDLSDGGWYFVELSASTGGVSTTYQLRVFDEDGNPVEGSLSAATTVGTHAGSLHGPITKATVHSRSGGDSASLGHLATWRHASLAPTNYVRTAVNGFSGEPAGRRAERITQRYGLTFHSVGDLDDTVPMGPQPRAQVLTLLRECETADQGILHEPREAIGIAYRTNRSRYNQATAVTLDVDSGEVAPPWQPEIDDRLVRNDIQVKVPSGAYGHATKTDGPLNTQEPSDDPVDGVGRNDIEVESNVFSEDVLDDHAQWRLLLGTVDEPRWPAIEANLVREQELSANTALVRELAAVDVGDLLVVTNPPDDVPPDDVRQLAIGMDETLTQVEWRIGFNTVPASPYLVAELEHATLGIVQASATTKNGAANSTQTSMSVKFGAGPDWVHEGDFDIVMAGERMTVTAVGAAAGTYPDRVASLTVVRSVNGVVKAQAAGEPVAFFHKAYIGL